MADNLTTIKPDPGHPRVIAQAPRQVAPVSFQLPDNLPEPLFDSWTKSPFIPKWSASVFVIPWLRIDLPAGQFPSPPGSFSTEKGRGRLPITPVVALDGTERLAS